MGLTKIRRLNKNLRSWTDKESKKHKHDFSDNCYIRKFTDRGISTYRVNKCLYCNSFREAEILLDASGISDDEVKVNLYSSHKTIGFDGSVLKGNESRN